MCILKSILQLVAFAICLCGGYSVAIADTLPANALASVNGRTVDSFIREAVVKQLKSNGQSVDEQQILTELINLELLSQKAEAAQLHKRDEIAALLRLQYTQTLAQSYMGELAKDITISEQELREEYDRQTADMTVDEYRASHILLDDEASAMQVIAELQEGADFATLAKSRSTGPTGPKGGDLGWFQLASMVPEFSDALKIMEVGDTSSAPVKSDFGWHVILLADKRGTNKPEYEDIKDELNNIVMREKLTRIIDQMRAEADIQIAQ